MSPKKESSRKFPETAKDRFFKMRADDVMLNILKENAAITGNTQSDEVRIAIMERNARLKKK